MNLYKWLRYNIIILYYIKGGNIFIHFTKSSIFLQERKWVWVYNNIIIINTKVYTCLCISFTTLHKHQHNII